MSDIQENQETELHDSVENDEIVSEAQEPKGSGVEKDKPELGKDAEKASVDAADKAANATKKAPARKGDKSNSEPMKKSGAKMEEVELDFSEDLNALVESEATLSDEFKGKAAVIFEAAVKSKLSQEIDRLEEQYQTQLDEEVQATKNELVEKVDSYLNYVVENWMKGNQLAIQNGLRTEIAEAFMGKLKDLFTESYIEVPESKVDLVDELAEEVEALEGKLNEATEQAIENAKLLEGYQREAVIREAAKDLADTEVEKLKGLVEDVDFEDEATFANKVKTIKESYFNKKTVEAQELEEEVEDNGEGVVTEEVSDLMSSYISAIRKVKK
jgi:hypothetical protein